MGGLHTHMYIHAIRRTCMHSITMTSPWHIAPYLRAKPRIHSIFCPGIIFVWRKNVYTSSLLIKSSPLNYVRMFRVHTSDSVNSKDLSSRLLPLASSTPDQEGRRRSSNEDSSQRGGHKHSGKYVVVVWRVMPLYYSMSSVWSLLLKIVVYLCIISPIIFYGGKKK